MENEKKTSRFGVRLSAIVVVVLLVVCMAVPAFAYGSLPEGVNFPAFLDNCLIVTETVSGQNGYRVYDLSQFDEIRVASNRYSFYKNGSSVSVDTWSTLPGWGYWQPGEASDSHLILNDGFEIVYSSWDFVREGNAYTFSPPPPPDPLESVSSGLSTVLDWVGATVSALFSGELAGLLPLVAIPVAITILIVAIVVIKRSIWGA